MGGNAPAKCKSKKSRRRKLKKEQEKKKKLAERKALLEAKQAQESKCVQQLLDQSKQKCYSNCVTVFKVRGPTGPTGPTGATGATGPVGPVGPSDLPVDRTVFVDIKYGDDTTGVREDMTKPFQHIQAAIEAAEDFDTIHVWTGSYNGPITLKKQVTIYLTAGTEISGNNGSVFTDEAGSIANSILGYGRLFADPGYILNLSYGTKVTLECEYISCDHLCNLVDPNSYVTIKAVDIVSNLVASTNRFINIVNGYLSLTCNTLSVTDDALGSFANGLIHQTDGNMYFDVKKTVFTANARPLFRVEAGFTYITVDDISGTTPGSVTMFANTGGNLFLEAKRLTFPQLTNNAFFQCAGTSNTNVIIEKVDATHATVISLNGASNFNGIINQIGSEAFSTSATMPSPILHNSSGNLYLKFNRFIMGTTNAAGGPVAIMYFSGDGNTVIEGNEFITSINSNNTTSRVLVLDNPDATVKIDIISFVILDSRLPFEIIHGNLLFKSQSFLCDIVTGLSSSTGVFQVSEDGNLKLQGGDYLVGGTVTSFLSVVDDGNLDAAIDYFSGDCGVLYTSSSQIIRYYAKQSLTTAELPSVVIDGSATSTEVTISGYFSTLFDTSVVITTTALHTIRLDGVILICDAGPAISTAVSRDIIAKPSIGNNDVETSPEIVTIIPTGAYTFDAAVV